MSIVSHGVCLQQGMLLNDTYKIRQAVDCSEMSIVYIGWDVKAGESRMVKEYFPKALALRDLDHRTVLKRLPGYAEIYEELRKNFAQEGHILKQLRHPNIVECLDYFEENGTSYLVMNRCRGKTLDKYIKSEEMCHTADFIGKTLLPLMETCDFIHSRGIIHRDIKPGNIMIGRGGQPMVLDFGSAIRLSERKNYFIFTTPGYSPLEFYSETSEQGVASDIYSLAATFYYCFTGIGPPDISERVISDRIVHVKRYNRKLTALLSHVIMWGLHVNYRKRCSSLGWMKITAYLESLVLKIRHR